MSTIAKLSPLEILDDVYVGLLLDGSSSMSGIKRATMAGYEALVRDQHSGPSVRFSVSVFNDKVRRIHNAVPIDTVSALVASDYQTEGQTALYDAIADEIASVDTLDVPPVSVVIAVVSDGDDNQSKHTLESIKTLVQQKQRLGWTFIFYAANDEAESAALEIGFSAENVKRYGQTELGTREAFKSLSDGTRKFIEVAAQGILSSGFFE